MQRLVRRIIPAGILLAVLFLPGSPLRSAETAPAPAASTAESIVKPAAPIQLPFQPTLDLTPVDPDGQVARFLKLDAAKLLAEAPPPPADPAARPADLKLRLVDYIDCTNAKDPHPALGDALGRVRESPIGNYRETGPTAGSWFAYRFRVAAAGRAHVVVLQFPDDEERITALALTQAPSADEAHPAARMEFGYRTGDLLPLTGNMLTRWTFFYPTSDDPAALLVASWHAHARAALARAWIYVVEDAKLPIAHGLQAVHATQEGDSQKKDEPATSFGRQGGRYDIDPRVVWSRFGGQVDNLVQNMDYLGLGELSVDALQERRFNYPSVRFGQGGQEIPELLSALDRSGKRLIPVFDPDCTTGVFTMPGEDQNVADISSGAARAAWTNFVETDFLKPYREQNALAGLMFGGPQGCAAFDVRPDIDQTSFLLDLAAKLKKNYQMRLYQNLAGASPYSHYLVTPNADWQPIGRWEVSDKPMDQCVTDLVHDYWLNYGFEDSALAAQNAVLLLRQCDRDDAAYFRFGHNPAPRYWLFEAIARSPGVTDLVARGKITGLIAWSTPEKRLLLLRSGEFWWPYIEMAPTIPPAGDDFLAPLSLAVAAGLEPQTTWLAGAGAQEALHENDVRQWLATFRNLPYRDFSPLPEAPAYPAAVRTYVLAGTRYLLLANTCPAPVKVTFNFTAATAARFVDQAAAENAARTLVVDLPPWGCRALTVADKIGLESVTEQSPQNEVLLLARLDKFAADLETARRAGVPLAPRYGQALKAAQRAVQDKDFAELDRQLHLAVVREPGLRLRLLTERPRAEVVAAPDAGFKIDGRLDDWKGITPIRLEAVENLAYNNYAANHWKGPQDLSAELYLAWSEAGLYYALKVVDETPTDDTNESSTLTFSAEAYKSYSSRPGFDFVLALPRQGDLTAADAVTRRQGTTTIHEGLIPAAQLGEKLRPVAGRTVGFNLIVCDCDDRTGMPYPWCKSNVMVWSNRQDGYQYWTDAQTCGEITFK
jgi:hypothetical protein